MKLAKKIIPAILSLILCAIFVLTATSCGKKESRAPHVWLIAPSSSAAEREIRNILDECDSKIAASFVPAEEMNMRMEWALERGEAPDVFMIYTDGIPDFAENKKLADLSARLSVSKVKADELMESARRACLYQGKTWGVPLFTDVYMLACNRALVSTVPENGEQLMAACKEIESKGLCAFEKLEPQKQSLLYEALLKEKGGKILNARRTELTFDSEAGRAALDDCKSVLGSVCDENDALANGKAAFSIYTTYERRLMEQRHPDSEISLDSLFGLERLSTVALAASADSPDQRKAFEILEYLAGKSDKLAALYKAYSADKNLSALSPEDNDAVPHIVEATPMPDLNGYDALQRVYIPSAIDKALKGVNTADALREAAEEASSNIWRGKRE